jgi:hypothetical protein
MSIPSGVKPSEFAQLTARLKPCPFKTATYSVVFLDIDLRIALAIAEIDCADEG